MSLVLKNRTTFNSLYELDASCFTKSNQVEDCAQVNAYTPMGVLGGTVAALGTTSYKVVPGTLTNKAIGLFVNNATGNPFDNAPAVASGKIAIAQKLASVEVDIYEDGEYAIGDKLYSSINGFLTKVASTDATVIGIVTKLPTASDPFLGLELSI